MLDEILARKHAEVAGIRANPGEAALAREAAAAAPARDFLAALRGPGAEPRVIAEFKRASPSRGAIRADAAPDEIARAYAGAGAVALSVLTDRDFFDGCLEDLRKARAACALPVLRKDFTLEPIQLLEARAAGADAALLIVAALEDARLRELLGCARELGLAALVEVHTAQELDRALEAGAELVGINNRDLKSFVTDVAVTRELAPRAAGCCVVSESGLSEAAVLRELGEAGADAFLVGEALMRAPDPGSALRDLRGVE